MALCALTFVAGCKGRHADATPNGETVEVDIAAPQDAATPHIDTVAPAPVPVIADTAAPEPTPATPLPDADSAAAL